MEVFFMDNFSNETKTLIIDILETIECSTYSDVQAELSKKILEKYGTDDDKPSTPSEPTISRYVRELGYIKVNNFYQKNDDFKLKEREFALQVLLKQANCRISKPVIHGFTYNFAKDKKTKGKKVFPKYYSVLLAMDRFEHGIHELILSTFTGKTEGSMVGCRCITYISDSDECIKLYQYLDSLCKKKFTFK
jgi:hypothetical protein